MSNTIFEGEWSNADDVRRDWRWPEPPTEVLYAAYDIDGCEGSAFMLFRLGRGQLFEVNDSHCSCNGLDNFGPEQTTKAALLMRPGLSERLRALVESLP